VNIPKGKGNIDHLVIGPTGMFLIETKNYSGFFEIVENNWYNLVVNLREIQGIKLD
jgi:hypothetical protein